MIENSSFFAKILTIKIMVEYTYDQSKEIWPSKELFYLESLQ